MITSSSFDKFRRLGQGWPFVAGLAFLVMVSLVLRVGLLNRHSLWADELFSLGIATGHSLEQAASLAEPELGDYVEFPEVVPVSRYADYLRHESPPAGVGRVIRAVFLSDTSPPLYYVLLYFWTLACGTSDAALRLFSVAWAIGCYPLLWQLARRFGGRAACWPTCILFTLAPVSVVYATEGRMYSLLWFWTLAMMAVTLRLQKDGGRLPLLVLWVLCSAAGLLTHYFFVFVWAAAVAWLGWHPRRLSRGWLVAACVAALLLVAPWYVWLPASLANWRVTGDWLNLVPREFNFVLAWLSLPWSFVTARTVWQVHAALDLLNFAVYTVLAIQAGTKLTSAWFRPRRQLLWLWALAPLVGIAVFDLWRQTYVVTVPRYALAAMPAVHLLIGLGLGSVSWVRRVVILLVLGATCLGGVSGIYQLGSRHTEPFREIGAYLRQRAEPADLILVHSIPSGVAGVARYAERFGDPEQRGPAFASWVGQLGSRQVPADIERLTATQRRVFLVKIHEVGTPTPQEAWLRARARLVGRKRFEAGTVLVFDLDETR